MIKGLEIFPIRNKHMMDSSLNPSAKMLSGCVFTMTFFIFEFWYRITSLINAQYFKKIIIQTHRVSSRMRSILSRIQIPSVFHTIMNLSCITHGTPSRLTEKTQWHQNATSKENSHTLSWVNLTLNKRQKCTIVQVYLKMISFLLPTSLVAFPIG